jgi:hypothetical protein
MKTKRCIKCKKLKSTDKFYKQSLSKDGLCSYCKACKEIINRKWIKDNPEIANKIHTKANKKWRKNNPKNVTKSNKNNIKNHPWYKTYSHIQNRCNNPKCASYPRYGGKGIKNFLTMKDLEYLWFRDKAYLMDRPSIDRRNTKGNYTLKNCRYIELTNNLKRIRHKNI